MALTELQLPDKTSFYQNVRSIANEMKKSMLRWQEASEFLARLTTGDMDTMTVPAGQVRTDLVEFRTVINEILSLMNGTATTPTYNPKTVIDRIRQMMVV